MQRDHWQFEFTGKKLAEAAAKKKVFHEGRQKWWEEQKEKIMKEIKETGLEVSESVAAPYSNKQSSHYGPQVMVKTEYQTKLSECHGKILEHLNKVKEYYGWHQVLSANLEKSLPLNADDYLFFFGE